MPCARHTDWRANNGETLNEFSHCDKVVANTHTHSQPHIPSVVLQLNNVELLHRVSVAALNLWKRWWKRCKRPNQVYNCLPNLIPLCAASELSSSRYADVPHNFIDRINTDKYKWECETKRDAAAGLLLDASSSVCIDRFSFRSWNGRAQATPFLSNFNLRWRRRCIPAEYCHFPKIEIWFSSHSFRPNDNKLVCVDIVWVCKVQTDHWLALHAHTAHTHSHTHTEQISVSLSP